MTAGVIFLGTCFWKEVLAITEGPGKGPGPTGLTWVPGQKSEPSAHAVDAPEAEMTREHKTTIWTMYQVFHPCRNETKRNCPTVE